MTERFEELGGQPHDGPVPKLSKPVLRRIIPGGCAHTEDPAGWITDEFGTIVDRCNCGEVGD
jgi:hypothetical protein